VRERMIGHDAVDQHVAGEPADERAERCRLGR
jgi:hypothetical protein